MHEPGIGTPWLECDPRNGPVEKTPLESFPFNIGRSDLADLCIDSYQVSRDHAVITRRGKKYFIRDLESTNGTFLNGQKIKESPLGDGDQLALADVEFTFYCGSHADSRRAATQVMPSSEASESRKVQDTILAIRRIHEVVTRQGLRVLFQPVVDPATREIMGYEALASGGAGDAGHARCEQWTGGIECRCAERLRQLFRRVAAETAGSLPGGRLFLAISAAECTAPWLVDHLSQVRNLLQGKRKLVVEMPESAVLDTADFLALISRLRESKIEVAYDGYASGKAQIAEHKDAAPEFLKLAPSLLRTARQGKDRNRQVQLMVRASQDLGSRVIASGIDSADDLESCRDMGCTLAQGELFGQPQTMAELMGQIKSTRSQLHAVEAS